jgi:hypothetical protein
MHIFTGCWWPSSISKIDVVRRTCFVFLLRGASNGAATGTFDALMGFEV